MSTDSFEDIIERLKDADDAYFNTDKVIMTDAEYDALRLAAFKMNKTHPYFVKVGSDVRGGKLKLPYPMNGLTQIFVGEIESHWVTKHGLKNSEIVITDKLDGVSCMLLFADKDGTGNADFQIAYSRGNSMEGADISRSVKHLDFPKTIAGCGLFVVRGELIIPEALFQKKYLGKYTTARAMVAGCMNRSITDPDILKDIHLVAYSVIATDVKKISKVNSLLELNVQGFKTPFTQIVRGYQLDDAFLETCIKTSKAASPYELDGVVLTSNDSNESIKYKIVDIGSVVQATVRDVAYEISKSGYYKPVVEIHPVKLYGTTVTYATGFNGKFIIDNEIGPGAVITITKSGSVIPYIMGISKPAKSAKYPDGNDFEWNDTGVELVVKDPDNHPIVKFKLVLDFFDTLDVELLKETSLKLFFDTLKLWNDSYEEILTTFFDLTEKEMEAVIGANGKKIHASLHRRLQNMKITTFLGALKYCGFGFGVRKAKQLMTQWGDEPLRHITTGDVARLHGFDIKTATRVAEGVKECLRFFRNNKDYITFEQVTKTNELTGTSFVFTGFRDADLEERIEKQGGKVSSGVSKKTTALVSAEGDSGSGKCKKAHENNVPILTVDEFKDKYNL